MDAQVVVEEVGLHQAAAAVGAEAADLAMGHLAGREAGHHAIGEAEGGVDVVDRAIGAATPGSRQAHHRRRGQLQHQVDVVNHQIEHHRHIVGPIGVGAVAAGLQHHHLLVGHHLEQFAEGGVEALDVAHLQQAGRGGGGLDQLSRLLLAGGDRLLDQHVQPRLQAGESRPGGATGWERRCRPPPRARSCRRNRRTSGSRTAPRRAAPGLIGIGHPHQFGIPQQAEHPCVVPAHVSDADDTHTHWVHGGGRAGGRIIDDQAPSRPETVIRTRSMRGPSMVRTSMRTPCQPRPSPGEGMCCSRSSRNPARV